MYRKNDKLVDWWSLVHIVSSAALAIILGPFVGLIIALLWEPFELFVLSKLLASRGIDFGNESWRNVASDIVFDLVGILLIVAFLNL